MSFSIEIMDTAGELVVADVVQTPQAIMAHLNACIWNAQSSEKDDRCDKFCTIGASIWNEASGDLLSITPEDNGLFELWMSTSGPRRKLLGFIPLRGEEIDFLREDSSRTIMEDAVRQFAKNNTPWFEKNFVKESPQ